MELDYLAMIWLSIWDPRLKANIFQLKEMSMSDWFFTRVGWGSAVGVRDLLIKSEVHGSFDFWEHRAAAEDEDEEAEFEELKDWITGEDEEPQSGFFQTPSTQTGQLGPSSLQNLGSQTGNKSVSSIVNEQNETAV
ncbi:hypothetical protein RvY_14603 [Ramazzottius varieornatus]|uniref:Uncharacterized protein n=1 Tax=Ramazzottius varieornatus TaxID=947166 RepID=A0A1D1VRZ7_RAMVA|nr:hypothetical protein RvY_14603 [Ramazzottius varieornatus]